MAAKQDPQEVRYYVRLSDQKIVRVRPAAHGWLVSRNGSAVYINHDELAAGYELCPDDADDQGTETPPAGRKDDQNKPRASLFPRVSYWSIVRVLEYGAKKYAPENWRKVPDARVRYYDAARRHLDAWFDGETLDPESGEHHLAHAACCLVFLMALDV